MILKQRLFAALTAVSVLLIGPSVAAGPYIGASIGQLDLDLPDFENTRGLQIFGGYNINPYFAVEVSYLDIDDTTDFFVPELSFGGDTLSLGVLGRLPVTNQFEVYGQVGVHRWDITIQETGFPDFDDDGTDMFYGVGATYTFRHGLGVGARFTIYDVDGIDINKSSVHLQYSFF